MGHWRLVSTFGTSNIIKTNTDNTKNAEERAISTSNLWSDSSVVIQTRSVGDSTKRLGRKPSLLLYNTTRLNHITDLSALSHASTLPKPQMNWTRCKLQRLPNEAWEITEGFHSCQWAISTQLAETRPQFLRNVPGNFRAFYPNTKQQIFLKSENLQAEVKRDSSTGNTNKMVNVYIWRGQSTRKNPGLPQGSLACTLKTGGLIILRNINCNILITAMLNMSRNCTTETNISASRIVLLLSWVKIWHALNLQILAAIDFLFAQGLIKICHPVT